MYYKQNNKISKTYVQGLRSFGNTLPRGVKGILKKHGYNYSEIISKWNMLVGKEMGNYSYPKSIKMKMGDKNGTLVIGIKRGNEISVEYAKKEIMDKINSFFGYKLINEIRLESYSSKNKIKISHKRFSSNFKKKISVIKNKNIKDSLEKLLKVVTND